MLFAFMHSNFLRLVRINVLAWGEEGGDWGTVKFLCQCPSLTLFLLLAHHVAVLDL